MEMKFARNNLYGAKYMFSILLLSMILFITGCGADESVNSSVSSSENTKEESTDIQKEESTDTQKESEEIEVELKKTEDILMATYSVMTKSTCFDTRFEGDLQSWVMFEYDTEGNLIKANTSDPGQGWVKLEYRFEYDQLGRIIKESAFGEDGELSFSYSYEYDETGNKKINYYSGSSGSVEFQYEYEYEHDSKGNVTKEICNKSGGLTNVSEWHEYEYDETGNKIKDAFYRSDARASGRWDEYEYDKLGHRIKKISYSSEGENYRHCEYEYNESGNLVKYITYDSKDIVAYIEFEYDESGNVIKKKMCDKDGNCNQWFEYNYSEYQFKTINKNTNPPSFMMFIISPFTDIYGEQIL